MTNDEFLIDIFSKAHDNRKKQYEKHVQKSNEIKEKMKLFKEYDKLKSYLEKNNYVFEELGNVDDGKQLVIYNNRHRSERLWDVMLTENTKASSDDLLETYGMPITDGVLSNLSSNDIEKYLKKGKLYTMDEWKKEGGKLDEDV